MIRSMIFVVRIAYEMYIGTGTPGGLGDCRDGDGECLGAPALVGNAVIYDRFQTKSWTVASGLAA